MQRAIVKLQYGTYKGNAIVYCNENDDTETIISRAWKQAKADFLCMAYKSAKIINRENVD